MYRITTLIAATTNDALLKNDFCTVGITFINNCDIDSILMQIRLDNIVSGKTLSLHFENLRGNDVLPVIDVYLNLEQESTPREKNYIGSLGLYGLPESSTDSSELYGSGQHRVFDVSRVFNKVRNQSNWSKKNFGVTLISNNLLPINAALTIGRISLYFNEI